MVELVFETHSTSVDNENGLASGHYDVPLSALGERQAEQLGDRYPPGAIAEVFCSDLQRCYRTAEIAFDGRPDVRISRDVRLRECDYGDWARRPHSQIATRRELQVRVPFPNGESYLQSTERVRRFLVDLWQQNQGRRVLVIGHRATQFALQHLLCGKRLDDVVAEPWSWRPGWTYELSMSPDDSRARSQRLR